MNDKLPGIAREIFRRGIALYGRKNVDRLRAGDTYAGQTWRILRYERILSPETTELPIARTAFVRPQTFRKHLSYLKRECKVVPLEELVTKIEDGEKIPDRTVAITVDGGYLDAYQFAFPILREFTLPATFYLATAFVGTENLFWQDKVLASLLSLRAARQPLPKLSAFTDEFYTHLDGLEGIPGEITTERATLIVALLSELAPSDRLTALIEIGQQAERVGGVRNSRVFLTWEEVAAMSKAGFDFGSLTHRNINLTEVVPQELAIDLRTSHDAFREHGITPKKPIALPGGVEFTELLVFFSTVGVKTVLGQGVRPVEMVDTPAKVLGRVLMYEGAAPTESIFACRLWGLTVGGIQF